MAVLNVSYMSYCLKRYVNFKVILPIEDTKTMSSNPADKPEKYKTLYLLHGYSGNSGDWLYGSRIFKIARDRNLAVVMPDGENSFYIDNRETGELYGTYVGEELIKITRKMFPLSEKREDTFLGGLSMGGFGSLLTGSRFAEQYSGIIILSGAFLLDEMKQHKSYPFEARQALEHLLLNADGSCDKEKDPYIMANEALQKGMLPPIYMACGTEDELYKYSVQMRDALTDVGADVTWDEGQGAHEWTFWDCYIEKAIDWWLKKVQRNKENRL